MKCFFLFVCSQVTELECSIAQLKQRLADTLDSLKGLARNQLSLEDDIKVKTNTLFIDDVECMGMRKSLNIQYFWAALTEDTKYRAEPGLTLLWPV